MQRMTKKGIEGIEGIAESVDAVRLAGKNIYAFDNATFQLERLEKGEDEKINTAIENVLKTFPNAKTCSVKTVAYSAGVYGCNGKLAEVKAFDSSWNALGVAGFVYF